MKSEGKNLVKLFDLSSKNIFVGDSRRKVNQNLEAVVENEEILDVSQVCLTRLAAGFPGAWLHYETNAVLFYSSNHLLRDPHPLVLVGPVEDLLEKVMENVVHSGEALVQAFLHGKSEIISDCLGKVGRVAPFEPRFQHPVEFCIWTSLFQR